LRDYPIRRIGIFDADRGPVATPETHPELFRQIERDERARRRRLLLLTPVGLARRALRAIVHPRRSWRGFRADVRWYRFYRSAAAVAAGQPRLTRRMAWQFTQMSR
jgi:hypothetical protein